MSEKILSHLPQFDPVSAKRRGFRHIDNDLDKKISKGDILMVPVQNPQDKKPEMVSLPYDETYGPLLAEFLTADPSEYGEKALEIKNGQGQVKAEWKTDQKGHFAYFTQLRFAERDIVLELALQKLETIALK